MVINRITPPSGINFPETYKRKQLNALYREIPLKDTTFRTLRKYFSAMANLYGCFCIKDAYDIIASQNQGMVSEDEFISFVEIARHECEGYYILSGKDLIPPRESYSVFDWEIIDTNLSVDNFVPYLKLVNKQKDYSFYVPEKKTFLKYENPFFCEESNITKKVYPYLTDNLVQEKMTADDVFSEIIYGIRYMDTDVVVMYQRLSMLGVEFNPKEKIFEFASLFEELQQHTRIQNLRGLTPTEAEPPSTKRNYLRISPAARFHRSSVV